MPASFSIHKQHINLFLIGRPGIQTFFNMSKIPGLSFSLKRAVGLTGLRQKAAHKIGVPTTKQGIERKIGSMVIKSIFGKK